METAQTGDISRTIVDIGDIVGATVWVPYDAIRGAMRLEKDIGVASIVKPACSIVAAYSVEGPLFLSPLHKREEAARVHAQFLVSGSDPFSWARLLEAASSVKPEEMDHWARTHFIHGINLQRALGVRTDLISAIGQEGSPVADLNWLRDRNDKRTMALELAYVQAHMITWPARYAEAYQRGMGADAGFSFRFKVFEGDADCTIFPGSAAFVKDSADHNRIFYQRLMVRKDGKGHYAVGVHAVGGEVLAKALPPERKTTNTVYETFYDGARGEVHRNVSSVPIYIDQQTGKTVTTIWPLPVEEQTLSRDEAVEQLAEWFLQGRVIQGISSHPDMYTNTQLMRSLDALHLMSFGRFIPPSREALRRFYIERLSALPSLRLDDIGNSSLSWKPGPKIQSEIDTWAAQVQPSLVILGVERPVTYHKIGDNISARVKLTAAEVYRLDALPLLRLGPLDARVVTSDDEMLLTSRLDALESLKDAVRGGERASAWKRFNAPERHSIQDYDAEKTVVPRPLPFGAASDGEPFLTFPAVTVDKDGIVMIAHFQSEEEAAAALSRLEDYLRARKEREQRSPQEVESHLGRLHLQANLVVGKLRSHDAFRAEEEIKAIMKGDTGAWEKYEALEKFVQQWPDTLAAVEEELRTGQYAQYWLMSPEGVISEELEQVLGEMESTYEGKRKQLDITKKAVADGDWRRGEKIDIGNISRFYFRLETLITIEQYL